MGMRYDWEEVLPEIIEEVDWTQFSDKQITNICEALDTHVNMTHEIDSYTHPSQEDLNQSRWYQEKQSLNANHKYETDWRDDEIKRLKNLVGNLYCHIDLLTNKDSQ